MYERMSTCVCVCGDGEAGLFDAALSVTWAALGPLIEVLLDCIVNMPHYRLYILRIIYQTKSWLARSLCLAIHN